MAYDQSIVVLRTGQVTKAIVPNSTSQQWTVPPVVTTAPSLAIAASGVPQVFTAVQMPEPRGVGAGFPSVKLYPICEPAGAFYLRVWGWEVCRFGPQAQTVPGSTNLQETWFPVLLAELYCQSSGMMGGPYFGQPGLIGAGQAGQLLDSETFCDQIDYSPVYQVSSLNAQGYPQSAPLVQQGVLLESWGLGTGLAAKAFVSLGQCQMFQVDFYQENSVPIGMNCLLAVA